VVYDVGGANQIETFDYDQWEIRGQLLMVTAIQPDMNVMHLVNYHVFFFHQSNNVQDEIRLFYNENGQISVKKCLGAVMMMH